MAGGEIRIDYQKAYRGTSKGSAPPTRRPSPSSELSVDSTTHGEDRPEGLPIQYQKS